MHVFETPGSVSLQIKLPSGRVLVTTADEPRTTVEVVAVGRRGQDAIDEIEVTMEERLGRYVVKVEQKDRFRWGPIQITWGGDFECRIVVPDRDRPRHVGRVDGSPCRRRARRGLGSNGVGRHPARVGAR